MSRNKYRASEKLNIVNEVECGEVGVNTVVKKYEFILSKWRGRYKVYGCYKGLEERTNNRSYSYELKLQAVSDYLESVLSQNQNKS